MVAPLALWPGLHSARERLDRGRRENSLHWNLDSRLLSDPHNDADCREGVPSDLEKTLLHTEVRVPKSLGPDHCDLSLHVSPGSRVRFGVWRWIQLIFCFSRFHASRFSWRRRADLARRAPRAILRVERRNQVQGAIGIGGQSRDHSAIANGHPFHRNALKQIRRILQNARDPVARPAEA